MLADAAMGAAFFGYFLLRQKKVARAIARKIRAAATQKKLGCANRLSSAPLILQRLNRA